MGFSLTKQNLLEIESRLSCFVFITEIISTPCSGCVPCSPCNEVHVSLILTLMNCFMPSSSSPLMCLKHNSLRMVTLSIWVFKLYFASCLRLRWSLIMLMEDKFWAFKLWSNWKANMSAQQQIQFAWYLRWRVISTDIGMMMRLEFNHEGWVDKAK